MFSILRLSALLLVVCVLAINASPAPEVEVDIVKRTCPIRRSPDGRRIIKRYYGCTMTTTTCPTLKTTTTTKTSTITGTSCPAPKITTTTKTTTTITKTATTITKITTIAN